MRLAYLSVPPEWKIAVADALYSLNVATAPMLTELSARVIVSEQYKQIIKMHQQHTMERNKIVDSYFSKDVCLGGGYNIFRWFLLPDGVTGAEFENIALSKGVQVFGAERFVMGNTPPERAVRLPIYTPETPEELEDGLKILAFILDF